MKRGFTAFALATTLLAASYATAEDPPAEPSVGQTPASPADDGMAGNVQFLIGQTYLSDFWQPLDEPPAFGVEVDFAPKTSPIRVALALHFSGESKTVVNSYFGLTGNVSAGFVEFSAGFAWLPVKRAVVRPYLGAGAVQMFAGVDTGNDFWNGGETDQSFGFYANAGVFFKVGDTFNIGIDGRIVRGTSITLLGFDGDADYEQVNMLFGFSWGE